MSANTSLAARYKKPLQPERLDSLFHLAEKLLCACKLYADNKQLHRLFEVLYRGICRCDTDILVVWVNSVREGRSGIRESYSCVGAELNDALCTAVKCVERYKVAACRLCPLAYSERSYLLVEHIAYKLELRSDYRLVLLHVLLHISKCAKEFNVAELIHLVVAYDADAEEFLELGYVLLACAHYGNSCARECYL